jgi:Transposase DDE domain group 1
MHWPATKITIRGDSHYGRHEAMAWCEANGVDYIFGLGGNDVLDRMVEAAADDVRVRWAEGESPLHPLLRRYAETRYGAASWKCERRVAARIEASANGLDIRYVFTNIRRGSPEWLYDTLYCERGQAENLIKLHKTQLASDRTSCRSPLANQVRLLLHTAAYWLLLTLRDAIPKPSRWRVPSSRRCGSAWSRSPPVSLRPRRGCASRSRHAAPRPTCSAASRAGFAGP